MKQGKEKDKLYISRSHTKARIAYLEIKNEKRKQESRKDKITDLKLTFGHKAKLLFRL